MLETDRQCPGECAERYGRGEDPGQRAFPGAIRGRLRSLRRRDGAAWRVWRRGPHGENRPIASLRQFDAVAGSDWSYSWSLRRRAWARLRTLESFARRVVLGRLRAFVAIEYSVISARRPSSSRVQM
jgi:hypothetical protein